MTAASRKRPARREGSTLLELSIVVAMTGILAAMAVPSFQRAIEQSKVDQAAATLRSIWAAQRFYKLDHGAYADDNTDPARTAIEVLEQAGLLDDDLDTAAFLFSVGDGGFPVQAERNGGTIWWGGLAIDQEGVITGQVVGDGHTLTPAFVFDD
jgi:Tfp pilus assembly protein PilE